MTGRQDAYRDVVEAAKKRTKGLINYAVLGYRTRGGTYVIASTGEVTDNGKPRDLVAITPGMAYGGSCVVPLYVGVDPEMIEALRQALDEPACDPSRPCGWSCECECLDTGTPGGCPGCGCGCLCVSCGHVDHGPHECREPLVEDGLLLGLCRCEGRVESW